MLQLLGSLSSTAERLGSIDFARSAPSILSVRSVTDEECGALKDLTKTHKEDSVPGSLLRNLLRNVANTSDDGAVDFATLTPKSLKRKADTLFDKLEEAAAKTGVSKDDMAVQQLRAQYAGLMSACRSLRRKIDLRQTGAKEHKVQEGNNEQEAEETMRALAQAQKTTAILKNEIAEAEAKHTTQKEHTTNETEQKEDRVAVLTVQLKQRQEDLANLRTVVSTVVSSSMHESEDSEVVQEEEQTQLAAEATCVEMRQKLLKLQVDTTEICSTDPQAQQVCEELRLVHAEVEKTSEKLKVTERQSQLAKRMTRQLVSNLDTQNPHVLALRLLNDNSGEMALDELKSAVGLKAIYTLVANSLIKIDRLQTPNTVLFLL
jgi:hypothetical protein